MIQQAVQAADSCASSPTTEHPPHAVGCAELTEDTTLRQGRVRSQRDVGADNRQRKSTLDERSRQRRTVDFDQITADPTAAANAVLTTLGMSPARLTTTLQTRPVAQHPRADW